MGKKYSIELPKGASPKVINVGKAIVKTHGKDELYKVAKLHFKTTKKIIVTNQLIILLKTLISFFIFTPIIILVWLNHSFHFTCKQCFQVSM